MPHLLLAILLAGAPLPLRAQSGPERALVLTRLAGPARAQLLEVDLVAGTHRALGRFPSDTLDPRAVAWDPVGAQAVAALAVGQDSWVVRLGVLGGAILSERGLGLVPGSVRAVAVAEGGDLVCATDGPAGGLWRLPRNGGLPTLLAAAPHGSALWAPGLSGHAWLAQGAAATATELSLFDLATGGRTTGPVPVPGMGGARTTGLADLTTGAIRQVLCDDQGRVHLFEFLAQLQTLPMAPPLPPGGAVALALHPSAASLGALVLGGAAHPYLTQVTVFGGVPGSQRPVAGPLPGDPVGFDRLPPPGADLVRFGRPCGGPGGPAWTSTGLPRLGAAFTFSVTRGPPSTPALAALGASDQTVFGLPLPLAMPGGCALLASAEVLLAVVTDPAGGAALSVGVPGQTALEGGVVFSQWVLLGATILSSDGAALHLGR